MKALDYHPDVHTVADFHDHPGYIEALANSVRDYQMRTASRPDKLVMSFHGVPQYTIDRGEPYQQHCLTTGKLLAEKLKLGEHQYQICFQSRFGRAEWIKPYTDQTVEALARSGVRVDIFTRRTSHGEPATVSVEPNLAVHHIDVQQIRAGPFHRRHLVRETSEIGGENGGGDIGF